MRRVALAVAVWLVTFSAHADDFDPTAARAALDAVPYKGCGTGGRGEVRVTFALDGRASAEVADGAYTQKTIDCIEARFAAAHVAPFTGAPSTIAYSLELPPTPTPPPQPAARRPRFDATTWQPGDRVPTGFHTESRLRAAPLIAGAIITAVGTALVSWAAWNLEGESRGDGPGPHDDGSYVSFYIVPFSVGLAHLLAGFICLGVGASGTDVLVPGPTTTSRAGGPRPQFAMTFAF